MRIALSLVVLSSLLVVGLAGGEESGPCDLKNVEKGFYCEDHDVLTSSELVSSVTYYTCKDCAEMSKKAGKCGICGEAMKKKVSGKGVCPHCFTKPIPVELCVKTYYECEECGHQSLTAGKCDDCESSWVKNVSRVAVEYTCPGCSEYSHRPGKCKDKECERYGKAMIRACSESGTFPHVSSAGKAD